MAYQEVKQTGYGTRVKNSFGGIATGFIMFIAATALLWWNEGRAVKTTKMLNEAQGNYVEMPDIKNADPQFDGKLVFATGLATTQDTLTDPVFGVSDLALRMQRKVEYYQWEEHAHEEKRDKYGGGEETITTYTYKKAWVSKPQESGAFHDPQYKNSNFVLMTAENADFASEDVTFGAYKLNAKQVESLPASQKVTLNVPAATMRQMDDNVRQAYNRATHRSYASSSSRYDDRYNGRDSYNDRDRYGDRNREMDERPQDAAPNSEFVHISENSIYIGLTPSAPSIGDVRITFTKAAPTNVSLIARVSGNTFTNYTAKNGKTFSSITPGIKTADEMFQAEHESNNMWTWGLRLLGLLLAIGGLKSIFGFLETLLKVIPPLAGILGFGVGLICSVVGFVWSLLIIALAWLFYRPLLGISLLVAGAVIIFAFSKKGKKLIAQHITKSDQASPQPSPVADGAAMPQQPTPQAAQPTQAAPQASQPSQPHKPADDAWT